MINVCTEAKEIRLNQADFAANFAYLFELQYLQV